MQSREDNKHPGTQPLPPPSADAATPAEREARLSAELETTRVRAIVAAKLVLDLNNRLENAGALRQQQAEQLAAGQSQLETLTAQWLAANDAYEQQIAVLRQEVLDVRRQYLATQDELLALQAAHATDSAALEELRQQQPILEQALAAERNLTRTTQDQWAQDKKDSQAAVEALLRQLNNTDDAVRASRAALAAKTEEHAGLAGQLAQAKQDLASHESTGQNLRAELDSSAAELASLRQQLTQRDVERAEQEKRFQEQSAALAAKSEEHTGLTDQLAEAQQDLEAHQSASQSLRAEVESSAAELAVLRQQLKQRDVQRAEQEQRFQEQSAALAAKTEEHAGLTDQLAEAQQDLASHESIGQSLRAEAESSTAEGASLSQPLPHSDLRRTEQEKRFEEPGAALVARPAGEPASSGTNGMPAETAIATEICPQMGLNTDRETRHGFASTKNRCYARGAPLEVTPTQQSNYCLCEHHRECPVFTGALRSPKAPINTENAGARRNLRLKLWGGKK